MIFVGRPSARADAQGTRLPSQETYAVQQEAPLFASNAQAAQPVQAAAAQPLQAAASQPVQAAASQPVQAAASQPIGVPEPSTGSFDFFDVGFKLIAVLALAYGSLMLLKRAGLGGSAAARAGGAIQRHAHCCRACAGAEPKCARAQGARWQNAAGRRHAQLGEPDRRPRDLPEDETPEAASFFDALKGKIGS